MKNCSISVIIPAFNCANTIIRCIESVLEQKTSPHEIIVIDDGSTDNTPEIIKRFSNHIHYIHQINRGPSAARNLGIKHATGEWVNFIDSDDYWLPQKTTVETESIYAYPHIRWFYSNYYMTDKLTNSSCLRNSNNFFTPNNPFYTFTDPLDALLLGVGWDPTSLCVNRNHLTKQGGFRENLKYAEDLDLFLTLMELDNSMGYINIPLSHHLYGNPEGLCHKLSIVKQIGILTQIEDNHNRRIAKTITQDKLTEFFHKLYISKINEYSENIKPYELWKCTRLLEKLPYQEKLEIWKFYLFKQFRKFYSQK